MANQRLLTGKAQQQVELITAGNWHHLVSMTYDGSSTIGMIGKIYIDGVVDTLELVVLGGALTCN